MFVIPVADLNSQAIEVVLDDILYYLILNWNDTGGYWTMAIRNASYQTLVEGISMVPNYPLTWQFRYIDMPRGDLQVGTAQYRNGPIPRDGFSSGVYQLVYMTELDLATLGVLNSFGRTYPNVV